MSPRSQPKGGDPGREVDLTPHRLAPRAGNKADLPDEGLSTLVGFIGESSEPGRVRLYTDLTFSTYYEINTDDVIRTSAVDAADPNSPTVLWVSKTAQVSLSSVHRTTGQAAYMSGSIRNRFQGLRGRAPSASDPVSDVLCTVFCEPQTKEPYPTDNPWSCGPSRSCTSDIFCA